MREPTAEGPSRPDEEMTGIRNGVDDVTDRFLDCLGRLPVGTSEGLYRGRRYGVTVQTSEDGRRSWLFGEERGGEDRVSCNLYRLRDRTLLKPCEMSPDKVIDFVLGFRLIP